MAYSLMELLALPDKEKLALAEELWGSIEDSNMPVTAEDILFADERLKIHEATPNDGMEWEDVMLTLKTKYGF